VSCTVESALALSEGPTDPAAALPYDQRQHARWLRILFLTLALADVGLLLTLPVRAIVLIAVAAAGALMLLAAWLFGSLRVQVDRAQIRVAYGPGFPRISP
jgi:hypothetical protein